MDDTNNNLDYPNQNQEPNLNLGKESETFQSTSEAQASTEAGNTYWEAPNTGNIPGQGQSQTTPSYSSESLQMSNNPYQGSVSSQPVHSPNRKPRKGLVAILIVVVLVMAAAGTAFAFKDRIINTLSLSTKKPEEYYAKVEKQAFDSMFNALSVAEIDSNKEIATKFSAKASYDKVTVNSLIQSTLGMSIEDIENELGIPLDSLNVDITSAANESNIYEHIVLGLNNIDIISAEILMDAAMKDILLRIPELSSALLSVNLDEIVSDDGLLMPSKPSFSPEQMPTNKETLDFLNRYFDIILDNIDDVELDKNKTLKVDDIKVTANLLTVTITEEDFLFILKDILKEAVNDDFILNLIPSFGITIADYKTTINDAIYEIEEAITEKDFSSNEVVMKLYVDSEGNILGRRISVEEDNMSLFAIEYAHVTKGDNSEYEFIFEDDLGIEVITVNGSHTKKNNAYSGKASIEVNDASSSVNNVGFDVEYKDVRSEVKNNKVFNYGTFTLSSLYMMGMELELDLNAKGNTQNADFYVKMGNSTLVSFETTTEYLDEFKIPTLSTSDEIYDAMTESDSYLATMDLENFINELSTKLGIDIESLFNMFVY